MTNLAAQHPWSPDSWKRLPALQQPDYEDPAAVDRALARIAAHPPLVTPGEIEHLRQALIEAGRGERFILQGGACAETFADCRADAIANKFRVLLQMSAILTYGARKPVVRLGRIAGQYAKPRSSDFENVNGRRIPSYRGDAVNSVEPDPELRKPDPERLVESYFHSAATLNHIRALIDGGFADLRHPYLWNVEWIERCRNWPQYKDMLDRILDAVSFLESFGGLQSEALGRVDFFTSHEGLLLGYEQALTRFDESSNRYYNESAHLLWIGARTRRIDGAHVEYFRGIANPIGVKIDADCDANELLDLLDILNPENEEGRIVLITRLGAERAQEALPPLIKSLLDDNRRVIWVCDPMHGNTTSTRDGIKTRDFSIILNELKRTFEIHEAQGAHLAGVHFELTAEAVTECVGGAEELTHEDLRRNYVTHCDPRLNNSQSLEMAFLIARFIQRR